MFYRYIFFLLLMIIVMTFSSCNNFAIPIESATMESDLMEETEEVSVAIASDKIVFFTGDIVELTRFENDREFEEVTKAFINAWSGVKVKKNSELDVLSVWIKCKSDYVNLTESEVTDVGIDYTKFYYTKNVDMETVAYFSVPCEKVDCKKLLKLAELDKVAYMEISVPFHMLAVPDEYIE